MNNKALVTGGAGFIGSNLVDTLIDDGYEVAVIDNESSSVNAQFYYNKKAQNYNINITDRKECSKVFADFKPDYVFHLAAHSRIPIAIKNPIESCDVNVVGTCNMLQQSRDHGVKRFMFSSTSSIYGLSNKCPLREDMPKDCLNPYSVSKAAAEELCKMYYNLFDLETVIFRYFNVFGERQPLNGQYAPVIGIFQKQKEAGVPMTIVGDGGQSRDFTYVGDVIKANLLAACSDNSNILGEVFNVGSGKSYSVLDIANVIDGEIKFIPERIGESRATLADLTKSEKLLEYSPSVDVTDWIKTYES
jgi:UDP-glucose 4-epimerase